jgi:hypothetical protein
MELAHQLDQSWRGDDGNLDIVRWHVWARKHGLLPWQQTRKAYIGGLEPKKPIEERYAPFRTITVAAMAACEVERLELKRTMMLAHERSVKQALETGEMVSQEVLADYPHLAHAQPLNPGDKH